MDEYPLRMKPVFKDYVWGGNTLKKLYKKNTPFKCTAESWEVADFADGKSTVDGGVYSEKTLSQLTKEFGKDFTGELCDTAEFPLMLKLIDANDDLPLQVSPDDVYAAETAEKGENCQAKNGMWYILDADVKSRLVYGFNKDITAEEFEKSLNDGSLSDNLNFVDAKEGDAFFIEAGTVHAVGDGLLIAEIGQNPGTTYCVFDRSSEKEDGKCSKLDKQVLEVAVTESSCGKEKMPALMVENESCRRKFLVCCKYFAAEQVETDDFSCEETDGRSFHIILFTKQDARIEYENGTVFAQAGDTFVIPASMGEYKINGECEYLKFYIPEFEKDILSPLANAGYSENEILALLK